MRRGRFEQAARIDARACDKPVLVLSRRRRRRRLEGRTKFPRALAQISPAGITF
jgi:hypothetical protein